MEMMIMMLIFISSLHLHTDRQVGSGFLSGNICCCTKCVMFSGGDVRQIQEINDNFFFKVIWLFRINSWLRLTKEQHSAILVKTELKHQLLAVIA